MDKLKLAARKKVKGMASNPMANYNDEKYYEPKLHGDGNG